MSAPDGGDVVRRAQESGALVFGEDGHEHGASVPKLLTGIPGFDLVTMGGLPRRRATVLAGQAGSAKTVFAGQFLAEGVRRGEGAVFVTLEEPAADLRLNLTTLGGDIAEWERAGTWRFVDASPLLGPGGELAPAAASLETLVAQIGHAVDRTAASRLVLDSLNAMLSLHPDPAQARQLLRALVSQLRGMGLTVVLTVETPGDPGASPSSYGVEEFVADNVVLLHNLREGRVRRRTVEVLKMRGAMHHKGEVAFIVQPGRGVVVLPVTEPDAAGPVGPPDRLGTGVPGLDAMTLGGLFAGSVVLVSGPTGTGKTLLATSFLAHGADRGESCLLLAYEESREQLGANARGWGIDLDGLVARGHLRVAALHPELASLDDHLVEIQDLVRRHRPRRLVVDSLSALGRLAPEASFREFVIRLCALVKREGITCLITAALSSEPGSSAVSDGHISALTDGIVLLRYLEVDGDVRRGMTVLKLRGGGHDSAVREFRITDSGLAVLEPFARTTGVVGSSASLR